jgi:hypothetical protein
VDRATVFFILDVRPPHKVRILAIRIATFSGVNCAKIPIILDIRHTHKACIFAMHLFFPLLYNFRLLSI